MKFTNWYFGASSELCSIFVFPQKEAWSLGLGKVWIKVNGDGVLGSKWSIHLGFFWKLTHILKSWGIGGVLRS